MLRIEEKIFSMYNGSLFCTAYGSKGGIIHVENGVFSSILNGKFLFLVTNHH